MAVLWEDRAAENLVSDGLWEMERSGSEAARKGMSRRYRARHRERGASSELDLWGLH